jgi:hypothetical protein
VHPAAIGRAMKDVINDNIEVGVAESNFGISNLN